MIMQTLPLRYTDAGDLRGRRSRIWGGHTSEFWFCSHCQRRQMEPVIARDRHTRPKCKRCGDVIYPIHEFEGISSDDRKVRCRLCSCFLRLENKSGICWPCQNRDSEEDPVVAQPSGVKTSDSLYAQSSPVKPVKKKSVKPKKEVLYHLPVPEKKIPVADPPESPAVGSFNRLQRMQEEEHNRQLAEVEKEAEYCRELHELQKANRYVAVRGNNAYQHCQGNHLVNLHPDELALKQDQEAEYNRQLSEVKTRLLLIRNVVRHAQNLTYAPSTQNLVRINKAVQMYDEHLEKNGGDGRLLLHDIEMEL